MRLYAYRMFEDVILSSSPLETENADVSVCFTHPEWLKLTDTPMGDGACYEVELALNLKTQIRKGARVYRKTTGRWRRRAERAV